MNIRRMVAQASHYRPQLLGIAVALVLICAAAVYLSGRLGSIREYSLVVRMSSSVPDTAQVFFDIGDGYNERDSSTAELRPGDNPESYLFRLPARRILSLRFDVLRGEGRVRILSGAIVDDRGRLARSFTAEDFLPRVHLREVERTKTGVLVETVMPPAGVALDPAMSIRLAPAFDAERSPIAPGRVALIAAALTLAVLAAGAAVRKIRKSARLREPAFHLQLAVWFTILLTFAHITALPLIAGYDGMHYTYLANLLLSGHAGAEWNFFRTPLFPVALKAAFVMGGVQPQAALLVTTLLGTGGALLIASSVRRIAGGSVAAVSLVLVACYPVLIGYQHMLLSETGTFFFLALLVWSLVERKHSAVRESAWFPCWLAVLIGASYYWRPPLLYLSPAAALVYIVVARGSRETPHSYAGLLNFVWSRRRQVVPGLLIVALGPWLVAYPWLRATTKRAPGLSGMIFAHGIYKQAVIPPNHPCLASLNGRYEAVLEKQAANGWVPLGGISAGDNSQLLTAVVTSAQKAGVGRLILENPLRYAAGVIRAMIFFLGFPAQPQDDENRSFAGTALGVWPADETMDRVPGWDRSFTEFSPPRYSGGALLGRLFSILMPFYTGLVIVCSCASMAWLGVSLWRMNPVGIVMAGIPMMFLFLHALTLFSMNRYAFPVYPIVLANGVVIADGLFRWLRSAVAGKVLNGDTGEYPSMNAATSPAKSPGETPTTVCRDPECILLLPADDTAEPELTVVVPAMNELLTISDTVAWCKEGFRKAGIAGEVLIVDSSTDETPRIALAGGARVLKTPKRGLGRAYIDALPYIRGRYVLMGDADCTYDFREIAGFVKAFREGFQFIMGSRFKGSIEDGAMPRLHRYFGTPLTTAILNVLYASRFSDIHCGMRGITRPALARIDLASQSWEYASEMVLKSVCLKLKTTEVPVRFLKDREGRASHMKRGGWLEPWRAGWINLRAMLVYGADFFVMKPGLLLLLAGLALTLPLTLGPVKVGPVTFSLYWMLLGMTLAVVGLQSFFIGCVVQVIYGYSSRSVERWMRMFSYGRSVAISTALVVAGVALALPLMMQYIHSGVLPGEPGRQNHMAVTGLLFMISGFMTFTSTLVLHATALHRRPAASS